MPIENRNLRAGMVLVAKYKGQQHKAEVVKTKEGLRYKLKGKEYGSPSAAGSAVTGRKTCDGWEFWSVEGAPPVKPRAQRMQVAQEGVKAAPRAKAKPGAAKPRAKATRAGKAKTKANGAKPEKDETTACGDCGEKFPNAKETAAHMRDNHGSVEAPGIGGG
jgi:hypothetical protein